MSGYNWRESGCLGVIGLLRYEQGLQNVGCSSPTGNSFKATRQSFEGLRRLFRLVRNGREKWIGLLSFGFFVFLFSSFFVIVPEYSDKVSAFFDSFDWAVVSEGSLPEPAGYHPVVYETVMRFCAVFGLFQSFVLALRFYFRSSVRKVAETISNIILWLGAAYMFNLLLSHSMEWVPLVGGVIGVVGLSLVVRSFVVLLFWRRREV